MLISRGYVNRRAGIGGTLAAIAASTMLAGCGLGGGGGSTTPTTASSAPVAPVVSSAGAAVEEQAGSGSGGGGTVAAGTISKGAAGKVTGGSTGSFTHASKTTFGVSQSHVTSGGSATTTPASTSNNNAAPPATQNSQTSQNQPVVPKKQVVVVTKYKVKVHTVYRNRTITKTITKTVPPKVPAGAFMPSKHPQLGQRAFTITGANVGCQIGQTGVRCGIKSRNWTAPVQPSSCRSTWGFTIALAYRGLASFACGGRNPIDSGAKVIPAGWDDHVGNYICEIRSFGVNCFNSKSRSGFLFGRTGYTLY